MLEDLLNAILRRIQLVNIQKCCFRERKRGSQFLCLSLTQGSFLNHVCTFVPSCSRPASAAALTLIDRHHMQEMEASAYPRRCFFPCRFNLDRTHSHLSSSLEQRIPVSVDLHPESSPLCSLLEHGKSRCTVRRFLIVQFNSQVLSLHSPSFRKSFWLESHSSY